MKKIIKLLAVLASFYSANASNDTTYICSYRLIDSALADLVRNLELQGEIDSDEILYISCFCTKDTQYLALSASKDRHELSNNSCAYEFLYPAFIGKSTVAGHESYLFGIYTHRYFQSDGITYLPEYVEWLPDQKNAQSKGRRICGEMFDEEEGPTVHIDVKMLKFKVIGNQFMRDEDTNTLFIGPNEVSY